MSGRPWTSSARPGRPLSLPALEPRVSLRRSRLEMMLKVLDVDGAVRRVTGGWTVTGEPWAYDAERYARVSAARDVEQQAMLEYIRTTECRMSFLREQLDDPAPEPCGRCDNCGGLQLPAAADQESVVAARAELDDPRCRRRAESAVADGDVVAGNRAVRSDPGRREGRDRASGRSAGRHRLGLGAPGAAATRRPRTVRFRCRCGTPWWRCWTAGCRPASPSGAGIRRRGVHRIRRAARAGPASRRRAGPVPVAAAGHVVRTRRSPPGASGTNSARRLAAVLERHRLADPAAVAGQRVLLVDDATETGWTLTVAARALRQAGATAVYPLVLAVR